MSSHLASAKINTALKHKTPTAADHVYQPGDLLLIWREKQIENCKGKFIGPYTVIASDPIHKNILVRKSNNGPLECYNTA